MLCPDLAYKRLITYSRAGSREMTRLEQFSLLSSAVRVTRA